MSKAKKSRPSELRLSEAHLSVLSGVRTQDVWSCFGGDETLSASLIQARLGFDSKAVYYQLRKLQKVGLIEPVAERGRARHYRRTARVVSMPTGFQGARYEKLAAGMVAAKLRSTIRHFERTSERSSDDPELADFLYIFSIRLQLGPDRLRELKNRLEGLLKEYADPSGREGRTLRFVAVGTPELD